MLLVIFNQRNNQTIELVNVLKFQLFVFLVAAFVAPTANGQSAHKTQPIELQKLSGTNLPVFGVVSFDGQRWISLGGEGAIEGTIKDMVSCENKLYAIGDLFLGDSKSVQHLACWDGNKWSGVDTPENKSPGQIVSFQNDLYVTTSTEATTTTNFISRANRRPIIVEGSTSRFETLYRRHERQWQRITVPVISPRFSELMVFRNALLMDVSSSEPRARLSEGTYRWDGKQASKVTFPRNITWVVENKDVTYVGGQHLLIGSVESPLAQGVASFDGTRWSGLREGVGMGVTCEDGVVFNGILYVLADALTVERWPLERERWGAKLDISSGARLLARKMTATSSNLFIMCDNELLVGNDDSFVSLGLERSKTLKVDYHSPPHGMYLMCTNGNALCLAGVSQVFQPYSDAERKQWESEKLAKKESQKGADKQKRQAEQVVLDQLIKTNAMELSKTLPKLKRPPDPATTYPPALNGDGSKVLELLGYVNEKVGALNEGDDFMMFYNRADQVWVLSFKSGGYLMHLSDLDPTSAQIATRAETSLAGNPTGRSSSAVRFTTRNSLKKITYCDSAGNGLVKQTDTLQIPCGYEGEQNAERVAKALAALIVAYGGKAEVVGGP